MQPKHQRPDDVELGFDDRCQNYDLCPLVSYLGKVYVFILLLCMGVKLGH